MEMFSRYIDVYHGKFFRLLTLLGNGITNESKTDRQIINDQSLPTG